MAKGIVTNYMDNCLLCGVPTQDVHHCVYGRAERRLSDEDGLVIPLCRGCHDTIHKNGVAGKLSKIIGQLAFEKAQVGAGASIENSRELFRRRYGRSYL